MNSVTATCLGFPRIGVKRELKKALEAYWSNQLSSEELEIVGKDLRTRHWQLMKEANLDQVPTGDFSFYDHMLDAAVAFGAVPSRYKKLTDPLRRYFAMARGHQDREAQVDIAALEMTKWFDTNYHYIVPELEQNQTFKLDASKFLSEIAEARKLGVEPRPVVPGPLTFLLLSKNSDHAENKSTTIDHLKALIPVYEELLATFAKSGITWVQLDEPCLVLDLDQKTKAAYETAFNVLSKAANRPQVMLTTYFGNLGDNLILATQSGFEALHIDLVRSPDQLPIVLSQLDKKMKLSLGVVDGRNIWRTDLDKAIAIVNTAANALGKDRILVSSSCSLLHTPVDLTAEKKLDAELKSWLAFSTQKLAEIKNISEAAYSSNAKGQFFEDARAALSSRASSLRTRNPQVRTQIAKVTPEMLERPSFSKRISKQRDRLKLPQFPTTTIGSFPQTGDVRGARAQWRSGKLSNESYNKFLQDETRRCVERQESIGLDVLVHGEFERTDMVEYFGEQMEGFAFTENGWVQSYGSRYVKPPVLFGDVSRPHAMTVEWSKYAQSLTKKPMKGMLTGPVTILQWSFVRDDQPRSETCKQIGLALRQEVSDLEAAGIPMIQVDEPAIREGLPLRRRDWNNYLRWAVDSFRLATSGVREDTQIHTHMCYSEFGDILNAIAEMDADVLSIETSRSKMELLSDFGKFKYPNEIGPGVYDIHSPRVPTRQEMIELLTRAAEVVPSNQLWVNPDCGLKTRGWPEVESALIGMVEAARNARETLNAKH